MEQKIKKKNDISFETLLRYIFLSLTGAGFFIGTFLAFINLDNPEYVNLYLIFPFIFFLFPYIIYSTYKYYSVNSKMQSMPRFLRDIVDSIEGGMDFISSIHSTTKTDYGSLNYDILKLSNRLHWGVNMYDSLDLFAKNIGDKSFMRDFKLVIQAQKIGGHVKIILKELSEKISVENLRTDKRQKDMSSNIVTGYISFGIFTLIVIILFSTLFSSLVFESNFQDNGQNPEEIVESYNTNLSLFIILSYELAILSGFLFGFMGKGSFISGGPHVIILVLIVFFIFFGYITLGISPDISIGSSIDTPSLG